MRNVLKILKRDLLRLLKTPQALVVVFALMVIPSLYTWYNVIGFWNPYDNTGNLTVCVVNQDAGGSSELTGELNVGGASWTSCMRTTSCTGNSPTTTRP